MGTTGRTLGSILLFPFWLIGRTAALVATSSTMIWDAFNDGLDGGSTSNNNTSTVLALTVVWLVVLTVRVW